MTAKVKEPKEQGESAKASQVKPECFVIMPIADRDGYESGHFERVYDWIIKPACEAAGYKPVRADEVSVSHLIVADILKRIVEAPMAICDFSSLNANVMFELGIRQAFGKPVALIKDERTKSVFDISGLRYTEYASSLRADLVKANVAQLATMIKETGEADSGMTSLMSLVDLDTAKVPQNAQVSDDSKLILQEIHKLSRRVGYLAPDSSNVMSISDLSISEVMEQVLNKRLGIDEIVSATGGLTEDELSFFLQERIGDQSKVPYYFEKVVKERQRSTSTPD